MTNDIWRAITEFYEPTLDMLQRWAWGLPLFMIVVALFTLQPWRSRERLTAKGLMQAVFPKEQHDHASARVDRWNGIILLAIGFPLSAFVAINAISIADNLAGYLSSEFGATGTSLQADWAVVAVQFTIYFLSLDFAGYWVHRFCHENPFMWNLHKPHHTAETLTPWTLFRQHPIEFFFLNTIPSLFAGLVTGLALYATGTTIHPGTVAAISVQVTVAFFVVDFLSHVHVPISYGWLDRIVLAPVMHNLHHSMEMEHRNVNHGVLLTVWDWMFGTLYLAKKGETWRWGLNEEEFGENNPHKTLRGFYLEPFVSVWKHLKQMAMRQQPQATAQRE